MADERREEDLLSWPVAATHGAGVVDGGVTVERPWGGLLLRSPGPVASGWWRLSASGESPVEVELRRVGSAETLVRRLSRGRGAWVRLQRGRHEARLWPGPAPGVRRLALRLSPAPAMATPWIRVQRAVRLLVDAGPGAVLARLTGRPVRASPRRPPAPAPVADSVSVIAAAFAANPTWLACYGDEIIDGLLDARPAWDIDLALRAAYAGDGVAFRDGRRPGDAVAAHAELLALHRAHGPGVIGRIPLPLAAGPARPVDLAALATVVREHLTLAGESGVGVEPRADGLGVEVRRTPAAWPRASLVIPTRDRPDLLDGCLESVFARTDYPDLEVVVVDNGSRASAAVASLERWAARPGVRVLRRDEPFNFARLCNAGVAAATGEVVVLLNDDVLTIDAGWLKALVGEAVRPEVGAVGALLQYADGSVQHAGIALGVFGHAGHPWRGLPLGGCREPRVMLAGGRSAVTGACLAVRREAWVAVGGMDEAAFAVTFNDVDLCLRLAERGWRTLYQPAARLIHLESQTRRPDHHPQDAARRDREAQAFLDRWGAAVADDPFYSPALGRADEGAAAR